MEPLRVKEEGRIRSVNEALRVLNEAADSSGEEIREMVDRDFRSLRRLFSEGSREAGGAIRELRSAAADTITHAKDRALERTRETARRIDDSAHRNPWSYLAGASAVAAIVGFLMGRRSRS